MSRWIVWGTLLVGTAFAEAQTFEAASVRPAPLANSRACGSRWEGGPGSSDPGRITYRNVSLATLVRVVYLGYPSASATYALSGPSWLDSDCLEIVATLALGTTWAQVRMMLQNLLVERFKLVIHSESRSISGYELVLGKDGPKLKPAGENPDSAPAGRGKTDSEGFPVPPPPGSWTITRNGHTRMQQLGSDMAALARQLTNQVGMPVTDRTGLRGTYDITLSWMADSAAAAASDPAPDLFLAVQQQLGLRLESAKMPFDVIVVDHAEKVPVGN